MRSVSRIGVAAALTLVAGGVVAPSPASARDLPSIEFTTVTLFNPTDPDTIPGYLQVQIGVTYLCSDPSPTMQGRYGPADQPIVVAPSCDGTSHNGFVYASVPSTEGADPVEAGGTYDASVSLEESGGGGAGSGGSSDSTVSEADLLSPLTEMFPPYFFRVRRSKSHPASQALVTWDPPLTTGTRTLTGYIVRDLDISLHAVVGPTKTRYVVKHLKAGHSYNIALTALAGTFGTIVSPLTVKLAHKARQKVSLHAKRLAGNKVKLSGHVRPRHGGHVTLQRLVQGSWTAIARLHLHHGSFHHNVQPSSESYRVVAKSTPDFKRAASHVVTAS
jgi:hypothetical protein